MLEESRVWKWAVVIAMLLFVTLPASAEDIVKLSGDRNYGGWEVVFGVGEFTTADLLAAGGWQRER
jgi:hypothetical protein